MFLCKRNIFTRTAVLHLDLGTQDDFLWNETTWEVGDMFPLLRTTWPAFLVEHRRPGDFEAK